MIKNPARKAGKRLPARGLQQSGGQPVAVLAWAELAWGLRGRRILSVTLFDSPAQRRRCQWYSATITQLCIADLRCRHHRPFALVGGDDGPQAERISFFFSARIHILAVRPPDYRQHRSDNPYRNPYRYPYLSLHLHLPYIYIYIYIDICWTCNLISGSSRAVRLGGMSHGPPSPPGLEGWLTSI